MRRLGQILPAPFLAAFLALMLALQSGALAQNVQTVTAPDYAAWENVAKRAEEAVAAGRASSVALEDLRGQIVSWRSKFKTAKNINAPGIKTLQAQLSALGPPPATGVEQADIAAQRAQLTAQLAKLSAPVKRAEVAYSRADSLATSIDKIIRDRQKNALVKLGPSPLNPAYWSAGLEAISRTGRGILNEITTAWASPIQRADMQQNLPKILFFLALALILLLRGRAWMERFTNAIETKMRTHGAGRWITGFALSVGQILLPLLGIYALTQSLYATGLVGLRGDVVLTGLPAMGLAFFAALWLGVRVFPKAESVISPLTLEPAQRRAGRLFAGLLGLFYALYIGLKAVSKFDNWPDTARVVVMFPLVVVCALVLGRLGQLLLAHVRAGHSGDQEGSYRDGLIRLLGQFVIAVAVVAPLLAAVGYFQAAQFLEFPTILSLALLGFLLVLQRVVAELYALLSGNREGAQESLVPVLLNFVLTLLSTPVLALIWGARMADLSELWARFQNGFTIGKTTISPTIFLTFAVLFTLGYMATKLVQGALKTSVLPKTRIDVGGRNAIVSGVGYLGIFLAAIIAITGAGIDLSSLAIVAGALSVGIGFGLQNIVSNFVSGIILLIERPISEGDWIEVGDKMGYVRDISVRSTRIETFDRTDVIIPNTDLVSGTVTNWTRGNSVGRAIIPVGVAYGTDTKLVEKILREIAEAHPMVLANPAPGVVFYGFGDSSLDFQIRAILRDVNWILAVKSDIRHEIVRRFAKEGIEMPFPQRDIWMRNPETLTGAKIVPKQPPAAAGPGDDDADDIPSRLPDETDLNADGVAAEGGDA